MKRSSILPPALPNLITGTSGDDVLSGTGGDDSIDCGDGNDYVGISGGLDIVNGGAGNDTLFGTFLSGGAGRDHLFVSSATGVAAGGSGNDTYYIGLDQFVFWDYGVQIDETQDGGIDTVVTYYGTVNLFATPWVENVRILGVGNTGALGNNLDNVLTGNDSANILDGFTGADTMRGQLGNDTYVVDNLGDRIIETAGGGRDTVLTSLTYTLADTLENLTLTGSAALNGTGNAFANALTGNDGSNQLSGGDGDDTLTGGLGADTLVGGAGNDLYIQNSIYVSNGQNLFDTITEAATGGTDTVVVSPNLGRYTYVLDENVENLQVTGTDIFRLWGNALANRLTGNSGANVLDGFAGHDTLTGGLGADEFHFSSLSAKSSDRITDFTPGTDHLHISAAAFGGGLAAGGFAWLVSGAAPQADPELGATGQFLYDTGTGDLFFDADGAGTGKAVVFATLAGLPSLTAADFVIIA